MSVRIMHKVTTRHPGGYQDGTHEIETVTDVDQEGDLTTRCSGAPFGASRTYLGGAERAIHEWMREHGCGVVSIETEGADLDAAAVAGFDAAADGRPRSSNPHPIGTDVHDEWDSGWLDARS